MQKGPISKIFDCINNWVKWVGTTKQTKKKKLRYPLKINEKERVIGGISELGTSNFYGNLVEEPKYMDSVTY